MKDTRYDCAYLVLNKLLLFNYYFLNSMVLMYYEIEVLNKSIYIFISLETGMHYERRIGWIHYKTNIQ